MCFKLCWKILVCRFRDRNTLLVVYNSNAPPSAFCPNNSPINIRVDFTMCGKVKHVVFFFQFYAFSHYCRFHVYSKYNLPLIINGQVWKKTHIYYHFYHFCGKLQISRMKNIYAPPLLLLFGLLYFFSKFRFHAHLYLLDSNRFSTKSGFLHWSTHRSLTRDCISAKAGNDDVVAADELFFFSFSFTSAYQCKLLRGDIIR